MIKEFKEFISKGNVMDMAVGIIIGGAFTAIVNSLVESILMPIIGALSGGLSVADMSVTVGNAAIGYGAFIQAIIDFLLIALVHSTKQKLLSPLKRNLHRKSLKRFLQTSLFLQRSVICSRNSSTGEFTCLQAAYY